MKITNDQKNQIKEVKANYSYFMDNYGKIRKKYPTEPFFLVRKKKIVGAFNTWKECKPLAEVLSYKGLTFSVQEIRNSFQSHKAYLGCNYPFHRRGFAMFMMYWTAGIYRAKKILDKIEKFLTKWILKT